MRPFSHVIWLGSLLAITAHAGAVLKIDRKDDSGKRVPNEVYYAQNGMLRIDSVDEHGNVDRIHIVRDGVIWDIQPLRRTYTRIDPAAMSQMMGGQSDRLQAMLAKMSPEQRAMVQARLGQMQQQPGVVDSKFTDTGRSDHAGQYGCRIWEERRGEVLRMHYCVASASSLPAGAELQAAVKQASDTASAIISKLPQAANQAERITRLGHLGGFPVSWQSLSSTGTVEEEHILSSASSQRLSDDQFAIPQGFSEKPLSGRSAE